MANFELMKAAQNKHGLLHISTKAQVILNESEVQFCQSNQKEQLQKMTCYL